MRVKEALLRKKRKTESWVKYILSIFHLWIALLSSLILLVVCITACLYSFKSQIQHLFIQKPIQREHKTINLDKAIISFNKKFGGATSVSLTNASEPIEVTSFSKQSLGKKVYFDPINGDVLDIQSEFSSLFFYYTLEIHQNLLLGKTGKMIIGISVLMFVFQLISGFVIWLPKKITDLKKSTTIRLKAKFYRLNYDLHRVLGFYITPFALIISFTGLYVSFHWVKNLSIQSMGGPSISLENDDTNLEMTEMLRSDFKMVFQDLMKDIEPKEINKSYNEILNLALQQSSFNGTRIMRLPESDKGYYQIQIFGTSFWNQSFSDLYIINKQGEIIKSDFFYQRPFYKQFIAIAKPLHTGEIFGLTSIIFYFIISVVTCSLPITGFLIWIKKIT